MMVSSARLQLGLRGGIALFILFTALFVQAQVDTPETSTPSSLVSRELIEDQIKDLQPAADSGDEEAAATLEMYHRILSSLDEIKLNQTAEASFQKAVTAAPEEIKLVLQKTATFQKGDPASSLEFGKQPALDPLQDLLKKEQSDLNVIQARQAETERRLTFENNRPALISSRREAARQQQDETTARLQTPPPTEQPAQQAQAQRWLDQARFMALNTEIRKLDAEQLSYTARTDLLKAYQVRDAAAEAWTTTRVKVINERVNSTRQAEAEQARVDTEESIRAAAGQDPVLVNLAEDNAALTATLSQRAALLDSLDSDYEKTSALKEHIEADQLDAEQTLKEHGLTRSLGHLLAMQRSKLPNVQAASRDLQFRANQIAETSAQRLLHREEERDLEDVEVKQAELEVQFTSVISEKDRLHLQKLLANKKELLSKSLEADKFYMEKLQRLAKAEKELLQAVHAYRTFLDGHLLWLQSAEPINLKSLTTIPNELQQWSTDKAWRDVWDVVRKHVLGNPVFLLVLLVVILLEVKRASIKRGIRDSATYVGQARRDHMRYTLQALFFTLLLAVPVPMLLFALGDFCVGYLSKSSSFHLLGKTLMVTALQLFYLTVLNYLCLSGGVAERHLQWPASSVQTLRHYLRIFTPPLILLIFASRLSFNLNHQMSQGVLARLGGIAACSLLALVFTRIFHPRKGIFAPLLQRADPGLLKRSYPLAFILMVAFPLLLAVELILGYTYSAIFLFRLLMHSLQMATGLVVLYGVSIRWIRLVRRRLALKELLAKRNAAREARQAGREGEETEEDDLLMVEEKEVDLDTLSEEARSLVRILVIVAGMIGFYFIWQPVMPALKIFNNATVWHYSVMVDGNQTKFPITLGNLVQALMYLAATVILVKRLPALLEMLLLRRLSISPADRYTITTLSKYVVIAVGMFLALKTIGARWSQLQWLAAALSVGIGFGLQEIVANFISGLIILFERPVRVGDVVTVGGADGVVTMIRIRATTIRTWDRKELLIPNKEFVTGRLFNWTLTDQVTRITVPVGVAYGTNVDAAMELMREAAEQHEHVMEDPAPMITFESFGDSALMLMMRAYLSSMEYRLATITDLNKAIDAKFKEAGIVIAFPQRELHLATEQALKIQVEKDPRRSPEKS